MILDELFFNQHMPNDTPQVSTQINKKSVISTAKTQMLKKCYKNKIHNVISNFLIIES